MSDALAARLGERLASCPGVSAVALGGSRAGGFSDARSDIDLGLYYRRDDPVDLAVLRALVAEIDDRGRAGARSVGLGRRGSVRLAAGEQREDVARRLLPTGALEISSQDGPLALDAGEVERLRPA